jgi:hypothetical protein
MGRPVGCASSLALDSARGMGSDEGKTVLRRWRKVGSPDYPAIRFTQGRLFGASWFAFAAACQVARPLCRSDQSSSGHRDFYLQASDESVISSRQADRYVCGVTRSTDRRDVWSD